MPKRSYKYMLEPEEEEDHSPPRMKLDFGKLFGTSHEEDNHKINHIYFYEDVEKETCLELCQKIRTVGRKLEEVALRYDLLELPKIYLHINSYGGCVFSAFVVIDCIRQSKIPIVTIVEGGTASAGTLIAVAGHERWITEYGYYLIHQLRSGFWGTMTEMDDEYSNNQELMRRIKQHYIRFSNGMLTNEQLDDILKHDIWWSAKDVLEYGLVDKVLSDDVEGIGNSLNVDEKKKKRKKRKS